MPQSNLVERECYARPIGSFEFRLGKLRTSGVDLAELRDASRKEQGVIRFEVARDREKPNVFVVWEEYRDVAALDAHVATEHYNRLVLNGLKPLALELSIDIATPI